MKFIVKVTTHHNHHLKDKTRHTQFNMPAVHYQDAQVLAKMFNDAEHVIDVERTAEVCVAFMTSRSWVYIPVSELESLSQDISKVRKEIGNN